MLYFLLYHDEKEKSSIARHNTVGHIVFHLWFDSNLKLESATSLDSVMVCYFPIRSSLPLTHFHSY